MGADEETTIGGLLRDYLQAREWRQADLLEALERRAAEEGRQAPTQPLVSMWMHDRCTIAPDHLQLVGDVLDWSDGERAKALELIARQAAERRAARRRVA